MYNRLLLKKKNELLNPKLIAAVVTVHIVADVIEGVAVDARQGYIKELAAEIRTMADVYGEEFSAVAENVKERVLKLNYQPLPLLTALAYVLRQYAKRAKYKYHKIDSNRKYEQPQIADKIFDAAIKRTIVDKRILADITRIMANVYNELVDNFKFI